MYETYSKEKIEKMYPILREEGVIINFVSCDGVMGYKLAAVIGTLNPKIKYNFQNKCRDRLIKKGIIISSLKEKPFTIQLPFKETFKNKADLEYLIAGFKKVEFAIKNKMIKTDRILIQRGIVPDEMLDVALEGLDLPEVVFFDDVNIYK